MALTNLEKCALDNTMITILTGLLKENFVSCETMSYDISFDTVINQLPNYTLRNIYACLDRIDYKFISYEIENEEELQNIDFRILHTTGKNKKITLAKYIALKDNSKIKKDKNLLYFECYPNLTYDFNTKTFSIDIKSFPNVYYVFNCDCTEMKMLLQYEWLFNYITDFKDISSFKYVNRDRYDLTKMPNGYFNYMKEKGLTPETFTEYCDYLVFGKGYKFVNRYMRGFREPSKLYNVCPIDIISKITKNALLNGSDMGSYTITDLYQLIAGCFKAGYSEERIKKAIDDNRDFNHNKTNLQNLIDEEKNKALATQLQKLNFLNNMEFGEYIVVVPQTQEEKQDEGRQQNNCVGYYYDNSILQGTDFIYFLRKKNNPKKSYITCRYNTSRRMTVEYRKVNNDDVDNDFEENLITKTITNIINENRTKLL